jgi:long-chain acyl-CoA synthetase
MHIYQHPDNLVTLCEDAIKKFSGNKLFGTKNSNSKYEWITYKQFGEHVNRLRAGMAGLGIGKGDMVGSLIRNSVEWAQIAFAAYGLGAHYVPLYENESQSTIKYIINDCKMKMLFVADLELKKSIKEIFSETPSLSHIYIIHGDGDYSLKELERLGSLNPVEAIHPNPYDHLYIRYNG